MNDAKGHRAELLQARLQPLVLSKQRRYRHLPIHPVPSLPLRLAGLAVDIGVEELAIQPFLYVVVSGPRALGVPGALGANAR